MMQLTEKQDHLPKQLSSTQPLLGAWCLSKLLSSDPELLYTQWEKMNA